METIHKSQPVDLNLAANTIPENEIWDSNQVVCDPGIGEGIDKTNYGVMLDIDLDEVAPITPPDGGWGWMIVIGSFLCMFLVDGVCFSYGIFLSELEATFGASKTMMTLAGSLLTGFYFMTGPIVGGLMNRFSARRLVVIGSLLSSTAMCVSSFLTNLPSFIGVFGVFGGIGYGMIYLPAATIVTTWFVKKRATVTGIIMAGSGVGVSFYSMLIPRLINAYTWRGCLFILSAVNLNAAVAGTLFLSITDVIRPETEKQYSDDRGLYTSNQTFQNIERTSSTMGSNLRISAGKLQKIGARKDSARLIADSAARAMAEQDDTIIDSTASGLNEPNARRSMKRDISRKSATSYDEFIITHGNQLVPVPEGVVLPQHAPPTERFPLMSVEAVNTIAEEVLTRKTFASQTNLEVPDMQHKRRTSNIWTGSLRWLASTHSQLGQQSQPLHQVIVKPADNSVVFVKSDNMGSTSYFASAISLKTGGIEGGLATMNETELREEIVSELRKEISRPVHRKDLFLSGSIAHLNEFLLTTNVDAYIRNVTAPVEEIQARNPITAMLMGLFNLEILRSPTFQLLNVASIVSIFGYIIPYQFLKDNAQLLGYDENQSAYLLSYMGILNTIGRLISGWLSDRPWVNVLLIHNASLILAGIATAISPLLKTYNLLIAYACIFGFIISAFIAVRTILIVEVLGLERLTNAFGFLLLFQGFAIIIAPPFLGSFYDHFGSFTVTFVFGGFAMIISGLMCLPLSRLSIWEGKRAINRLSDLEEAVVDMYTEDDVDEKADEEVEGYTRRTPMHLVRQMRDWSVRRFSGNQPKKDHSVSK